MLLQLLTVASREKNSAYIRTVLDNVYPYKQAYRHLFEDMYMSEELRKQVIYALINDSFKDVKELDELIEQIGKFYSSKRSLLCSSDL